MVLRRSREAAPAATPTPPSPYETGAPNVAGGTPVVPQMASQMIISGEDLNSRPVIHPAEILEAAPGLAIVEHADAGKANQYYLRGYDLDHGTDLADILGRRANQFADPCPWAGVHRSKLSHS